MSDRRLTLTDVMVGLHKHDLINILSEEEWMLLTGLILYANERGFKNPIGLAVKQATHAGGGNNRQSVNRRRKSLAKIKINGKPILKVKAGVPGQNIVAEYEIDYNLICSYNGMWYDENEEASQKCDGKRTRGGREADGSRDHPKIRSEEKREVDPPKTLSPKRGISAEVNIKRALSDKWDMFSVSDMEVQKLLTTLTSFKGVPDARDDDRNPAPIPPEYAPLEFWFDMINRMNGKPDNGINSIIEYGRKAWKDWATQHKIQIFN